MDSSSFAAENIKLYIHCIIYQCFKVKSCYDNTANSQVTN
ncbi:hypothetical protein AG1IA_01500 [Rhizoctonia solani AG-1 IA]|uniref:Uncharacterized protein n=1 Tax=Thanatephorus cucumeris (strain AG1-IA) TaxID=983506 RepID=L8X2C4_THACA|nr:hypothetical protein AG1IA_01500 [Rhizoctonia solani AG-1 IA]